MKYFELYIKPALEKFYKNDSYLIEKNVHEQTMSSRIAHYLIEDIEEKYKLYGINVDCEYNRLNNVIKIIPGSNKKRNRSDIVVHERGSISNNKFVIEIKKGRGDSDKFRIKLLVDNPKFKYEEGYVIFGIKKNCFRLFFYDGTNQGEESNWLVERRHE